MLASVAIDRRRCRTFQAIDAPLWVLESQDGVLLWRLYDREEYSVPLTVCLGDLAACCTQLQALRDKCPLDVDSCCVWEPRIIGEHNAAITRIGEFVRFGLRWVVVANGGRRMPLHGENFSGVFQPAEHGPFASFEFSLRTEYERKLRVLDEKAGAPTG